MMCRQWLPQQPTTRSTRVEDPSTLVYALPKQLTYRPRQDGIQITRSIWGLRLLRLGDAFLRDLVGLAQCVQRSDHPWCHLSRRLSGTSSTLTYSFALMSGPEKRVICPDRSLGKYLCLLCGRSSIQNAISTTTGLRSINWISHLRSQPSTRRRLTPPIKTLLPWPKLKRASGAC